MSDTLDRAGAAAFLTSVGGVWMLPPHLIKRAIDGSGPPFEAIDGVAHYSRNDLLIFAVAERARRRQRRADRREAAR